MVDRRKKKGQRDRSLAVGLIRVSTSEQHHIGAGAQRDELHAWAAHAGVTLLSVHEELGVSGGLPLARRPGLLAALEALETAGAGVLVAVARDRFARHLHTIADLERAVARVGAVLVTTDGVSTGEGSEAEAARAELHDLFACRELRDIKARNKARAQRCIAEGRTHGGRLPYGKRRRESGVTGRGGRVMELEDDPKQQVEIQRMKRWRKKGVSYSAIARKLEEGKTPGPTGGRWYPTGVRRILERAVQRAVALENEE